MLAQELARIIRRVFRVKIRQLLFETVLFFNPVARWINHRIRGEREDSCDTLAAVFGGEL